MHQSASVTHRIEFLEGFGHSYYFKVLFANVVSSRNSINQTHSSVVLSSLSKCTRRMRRYSVIEYAMVLAILFVFCDNIIPSSFFVFYFKQFVGNTSNNRFVWLQHGVIMSRVLGSSELEKLLLVMTIFFNLENRSFDEQSSLFLWSSVCNSEF